MRIGLVGCVKSKLLIAVPAQDLYVSPLFKGRRQYVERSCDQWFILSAKHGLVHPLEVIEPYDVALSEQSVTYRHAWSHEVVLQLQRRLGDLAGVTFDIHAGASYRNSGLAEGLRSLNARVEVPTEGYRFGELLAFYSNEVRPSGKPDDEVAPTPPARFERGRPLGARTGYEKIGQFLDGSGVDQLTLTFDEVEELIGRPLPLSATKYGVWWANSATNPQSGGWVRAGWKVHNIKVGDREVRFRRSETNHESAKPDEGSALTIEDHEGSDPQLRLRDQSLDTKAIVEAMLNYASSLTKRRQSEGISYTPNAAANTFVLTNPFAFLIAVIFDQGITAERAWAAPYELSRRLGHLDPQKLAVQQESIRSAVQQRPKLHRFVNDLPEWISAAAEKVVREYGGNAANIWNDSPTAKVLFDRLVDFRGIGQKKAAMAVELLERDFAIPITGMEGSDVAFDVHVRRVFLRTGLGNVDRLEDTIRSAREHHPERPGSLDGPAWQIGRRWCRPTNPLCAECVLTVVCPRFVDRANSVKGV